VKGLDGRAHHIDYSYIWNKMPMFPKIIYYIGDMGCHQKESRSFILNENQMPVCARDTGIFIGMAFALFFSLFITPSGDFLENLSQLYFKYLKKHLSFAITIFLLLPLVIDGFFQLLTPYESNNTIRFFTGACAGISISFLALSSFLMLAE
jgi:uncharacterized membrane protein